MTKADCILYSRDTDIATQMDEQNLSDPSTSFPYAHFEVNMNQTKTFEREHSRRCFHWLLCIHQKQKKFLQDMTAFQFYVFFNIK